MEWVQGVERLPKEHEALTSIPVPISKLIKLKNYMGAEGVAQ
jgi:hypothetical protein